MTSRSSENDKKKNYIVTFKSIPEMYAKEFSGKKPNTVRKIDYSDDRFIRLLSGMVHGIIIVNTVTGKSFIRRITDVTEWDGYAIISWRLEHE